jgi:hypothetical protein
MIYGPKPDGTYIVEFRIANDEALAINVPAGETRVLKVSTSECPMGYACRTLAEEHSVLFGVRLACRGVQTCTDSEQPRRKNVRRRQRTRTSKAHSKTWRALGCYLPSKWSRWTSESS